MTPTGICLGDGTHAIRANDPRTKAHPNKDEVRPQANTHPATRAKTRGIPASQLPTGALILSCPGSGLFQLSLPKFGEGREGLHPQSPSI